MVTTTVSIDPADALFLEWASGINASGLFREALSEQMDYRDIDRDELVALVEEVLCDEETELTDLYERTSDIDDLEAVLANTQGTTLNPTND